MSRFNKPPIVEAWLAFEFDPKPDKVAWDKARVQEFMQQQKDEFPKVEVMFREEYRLEESKDGSLPQVVSQERSPEVVRMRDMDSKRVLQIADDRLAYNVLEGGEAYPGFETLLSESLVYLDKYCDFFDPAGIRQAILHYIDIVDITVNSGTTTDLNDYFTLVHDLPEQTFGLIVGFATKYVTICPLDGQLLEVSLESVPSGESGTVRFRMEWTKYCKNIDFPNHKALQSGLHESHNFMVSCFEESITSKTRALFDPKDGK